MNEGITNCQVCGLPTIIQFGYTFCTGCYPPRLVCVTCGEDGHIHINECRHRIAESIKQEISLLATRQDVTPDTPTARKRCATCRIEL